MNLQVTIELAIAIITALALVISIVRYSIQSAHRNGEVDEKIRNINKQLDARRNDRDTNAKEHEEIKDDIRNVNVHISRVEGKIDVLSATIHASGVVKRQDGN